MDHRIIILIASITAAAALTVFVAYLTTGLAVPYLAPVLVALALALILARRYRRR